MKNFLFPYLFIHSLKLIVIYFFTESGVTINENERTRLLLKVLAVSDIVIYRTRSERLHRDLFTFLGAASRAYSNHFQSALLALSRREGAPTTSSALGPSVIVFHETRHTLPLTSSIIIFIFSLNNIFLFLSVIYSFQYFIFYFYSDTSESAEDILRNRFAQMRLEIEAFSSIKYVGVQTPNPPTDYSPLRVAIENELDNTTVRSARKPHHVYGTLKILNDKFSGEVENVSNVLFPDQYFTCPVKCRSCECRCRNSMGHSREGIPHHSDTRLVMK